MIPTNIADLPCISPLVVNKMASVPSLLFNIYDGNTFSPGVWHQYDDVLQLKRKNKDVGTMKKVTAALSSVGSYLLGMGGGTDKDTKEVPRLVQDRQLAIFTHLPKWEGFLVEGTTKENMKAVDAIQQLEQVMTGAAFAMVRAGYGGPLQNWTPDGFDGIQVSQMLKSFFIASNKPSYLVRLTLYVFVF